MNHFTHCRRTAGFSLVELAIVIVVVGLIVGGVMTGRGLLRAAELRSIVVDAERYINAIGTFQDKYDALPGDMYNAESVWGEAVASNACETTNSVGVKTTCNGDGDGMIEGQVSGAGGHNTNETFRSWHHLSNAGMIEASVTGISKGGAAGTTYSSTSGTGTSAQNVPISKHAGAGFTLYYTAGGGNFYGSITYNNILNFGLPTTNGITDTAALSASDAQSLDVKVDDGKPGTGNVLTYSTVAACVDSATAYDVANQTSQTRVCNMIFITGF